MAYKTIVTCPVCGEVFDEITHDTRKPDAFGIALLAGDGRSQHGRESPRCRESSAWWEGWHLRTEPISDGKESES